ncbi:two partner secretion A domain protein, partial [Neisseria meningitidis NM518]
TRRLYRRHSERQSENRNRKAGQTARIRLPETASDGQERRLETGAAGLRQMGL